jgi:hypothetical protein
MDSLRSQPYPEHLRIVRISDEETVMHTDVTPDRRLQLPRPLKLPDRLRTVARVRQSFVTQGLQAAIEGKSQPPWPDKVKIKGDLEQKLVRLACSDPPRERCHWTLQLLADELVVLGLVDTISTETVRQALKKRHPALDRRDLVYPAEGRCRVRLAQGRRDPDVPAVLRPGLPDGLL